MRVYTEHKSALIFDEMLKLNMFVYSHTGEVKAWFKALQPDEIDSWLKLVHIIIYEWSLVAGRMQIVNTNLYFRQLEDKLLSEV